MAETDEQSIQFIEHAQGKYWILTTRHSAYVIGVTENGRLSHVYWGDRLLKPADYPGVARPLANTYQSWPDDEYPAWGGTLYTEPCLKVTCADGNRDTKLIYHAFRQERDASGLPVLIITLKEQVYPLEVDLSYRIIPACDLLERKAIVRNTGTNWVDLESVLSAAWHLPLLSTGQYRLTHLSGRWNSETQLRRTTLSAGRQVLESRRGLTSHEANPFFAIDIQTSESAGASEEHGQVWFGGLAWSGNWKISIEQQYDPLRAYVAGGVNDFDFRWRLAAGEEFSTPPFIAGYTSQGFGQASRNLHRYQLDYLLPATAAHTLRPVLYNSWEAVYFDVNEEKQLALAQRAAQLGVELFVVDDGWFGERHHDRAGLGDWWVNPQKFPRGLGPLIDEVHRLGMKFGIWVEPEMVNPDSDLYRAHPDWIYHFPEREGTQLRNQFLLNLARPEVAAYVFDCLDRLLGEHAIEFIKWDFNRSITEPGWPDAPLEGQREIYVRHIQAFYQIVERLRARYPSVLWEACAGGGGRVDLGALARFDQCWTSDNTDPFDRLVIQEGYSLAYAPKTMMAWVSNSPHSAEINNRVLDLTYRFHSAMTGSLGLGEDLHRYSEAEMELVAKLVAEYKAIRHIVQHGLLYRLASPRTGDLAAVQYVSEDRRESVLFAFRHARHYWQTTPRIYPRGLEAGALYRIEGIANEHHPVSGQSLMSVGLAPELRGHLASALVKLSLVEEK
jgi:alpha-galactosidase